MLRVHYRSQQQWSGIPAVIVDVCAAATTKAPADRVWEVLAAG